MRAAIPLATRTLALALACGGGGDEPPALPDAAPPDAAPPEGVTPPAATAPSACPPGVARTMGWQGEYPSPVIHVKQEVLLPAHVDPCEAATEMTCTLAPGVYHPWSATTSAGYATVRPVDVYRAKVAMDVELDAGGTKAVAAGTTVNVPFYMGEGFCAFEAAGATWQGECPGMGGDEDPWETVSKHDGGDRQLMSVPCADGRTGWIDVDASLMGRPEVAEGTIVGYGEVGPSAD